MCFELHVKNLGQIFSTASSKTPTFFNSVLQSSGVGLTFESHCANGFRCHSEAASKQETQTCSMICRLFHSAFLGCELGGNGVCLLYGVYHTHLPSPFQRTVSSDAQNISVSWYAYSVCLFLFYFIF